LDYGGPLVVWLFFLHFLLLSRLITAMRKRRLLRSIVYPRMDTASFLCRLVIRDFHSSLYFRPPSPDVQIPRQLPINGSSRQSPASLPPLPFGRLPAGGDAGIDLESIFPPAAFEGGCACGGRTSQLVLYPKPGAMFLATLCSLSCDTFSISLSIFLPGGTKSGLR